MNLRSPPSRRWFRARGPNHRGVRSSQYRRVHRRNGWSVARKLTGDSHRRQFKGCGASEMTIIERIDVRWGGVATSVGWISCERETDCRDGSNETLDPIPCRSGHYFSGKRRSDLWHKLVRPTMSLSRAVFSRGVARHLGCAVRGRLLCLEQPKLDPPLKAF